MMNKKNIDRLIPQAISKLNTLVEEDGKIDKKNQGYLASFGPIALQSGIVKSVAIYADKSDSNRARREVLDIMFSLIDMSVDEYISQDSNATDYKLRQKILEANIACKLAIRTFELKE